jgi:hypothetical protein
LIVRFDFHLRAMGSSRICTGILRVTHRWAGLRLNNSSPRPEAGWLAAPRPPCLLPGSLGPRHRPCWLAWQGQDSHDCPLRFVGFHVDPCLLSESPSALWELGQRAPNAQHESKASQPPSQSRPANVGLKRLVSDLRRLIGLQWEALLRCLQQSK